MLPPANYQNHVQHYQNDAQFFDYFEEDRFRRQENRRRYEAIFDFLKPRRGDRILEIGSGGAPGLALVHHEGLRYVPLDLASINLARLKRSDEKILPCCGDGYCPPFKPDVFDGIILSEVLEHLADPSTVLREAFRILKPGGRIVVSVPYQERLTYQMCIHCNRPTPTNAHLHSFGPSNLGEIVRAAGFDIVRWRKHCNKVPNRIHLYRWIAPFPYWFWKGVDQAFHRIVDKPSTLILVATKAESSIRKDVREKKTKGRS